MTHPDLTNVSPWNAISSRVARGMTAHSAITWLSSKASDGSLMVQLRKPEVTELQKGFWSKRVVRRDQPSK